MRHNAREEIYTEIRVLGKPALFHSMRLDRNTVPQGLYLYEIRHDDASIGEPVQLAERILVNHFGTILTKEPISLGPDGYLDIAVKKDWDSNGGKRRTVEEFMKEEPCPGKAENRNSQDGTQ